MNAEFTDHLDVKRQEIVNTALIYGFNEQQIDEAIKSVTKPTGEYKIDDVLGYLSKTYPQVAPM